MVLGPAVTTLFFRYCRSSRTGQSPSGTWYGSDPVKVCIPCRQYSAADAKPLFRTGNIISSSGLASIIYKKTASAACTSRSFSMCSTCFACCWSVMGYQPLTESCRSAASTSHSKSNPSRMYFSIHTTVTRSRPANQKACRSASLLLSRAMKAGSLTLYLCCVSHCSWWLVDSLQNPVKGSDEYCRRAIAGNFHQICCHLYCRSVFWAIKHAVRE